jgi:hypothetical protein
MKAIRFLVAAVLALAALQASAQRMPVPIVNHEHVVLRRGDGQSASAEQVRAAVVAAAQATGRKWDVVETAPGQLLATYHVRTHTVSTDIRYGDGQLSLVYHDSVNMKFVPGGGPASGSIHPFYNQWVDEFLQAIRQELAKS